MRGKKTIVGISVGDIHGIGIEIIIDAFTQSKLLEKCIPIIFNSQWEQITNNSMFIVWYFCKINIF